MTPISRGFTGLWIKFSKRAGFEEQNEAVKVMQKYTMHQIPSHKASTTVFPASVYFLIQDNVFKVDPNNIRHYTDMHMLVIMWPGSCVPNF